jgi:ferredoxin
MRRYGSGGMDASPTVKLPVTSIAHVRRAPDRFAQITLADGAVGEATCLNCPDSPCVSLLEAELDSDVGVATNRYHSKNVCVFGALSWDVDNRVPYVDSPACTGCGACLARCPVGAIRLHEGGVAQVNTGASPLFIETTFNSGAFEAVRNKATETTSAQCSTHATSRVLDQLGTIMAALAAHWDPGLGRRLLARNLLLALGMPAHAAPPGNTNYRLELVFLDDGRLTLAEVDTGEGMLDAVRRLLANYAIATSRFGVDRDSTAAAIICAEFPNKRRDVYELVDNVRERLGVAIHVVPLAFLILAAAYGFRHDQVRLSDRFLLSREDRDTLEDVIAILGGCAPKTTSRYFGPEK